MGNMTMKTLKNIAAVPVVGFVLGLIYAATDRRYNYVVVSLLLVLAYLIWEVIRWLKRIAGALGVVPARTERINLLMKKLEDSEFADPAKRITDAEQEELQELTHADWHAEPAKTAQLVRIIELLFSNEKWLRPETKQLDAIIERLDCMTKALENSAR